MKASGLRLYLVIVLVRPQPAVCPQLPLQLLQLVAAGVQRQVPSTPLRSQLEQTRQGLWRTFEHAQTCVLATSRSGCPAACMQQGRRHISHPGRPSLQPTPPCTADLL